ncbi:MAG: DUF4421 family protein [Bacteroidales bacterium]|nr:DUF4421 family protein [Bacteroidales bacterium]
MIRFGKKSFFRISFGLFLLASTFASAQTELSKGIEEKAFRYPLLKRLDNYLESRELSGVDTNYIGVPKRKWSVFLNTYLSRMDFNLSSRLAEGDDFGDKTGKLITQSVINMHSKANKQISLGLYYRGYGLSYSFNLGKGYNKDWSFAIYSSPVGGEFRYHSTKKIKGDIEFKGADVKLDLTTGTAKMENFILNAYYVFSPRKFSYSPAMNYSKIQKRSAGSFLAGLTLNRTRLRAYDPWLGYALGRVNRLNIQQFALGAGYGYNWVPMKGLTVHLSAIPMLLVTTKSDTEMKAAPDSDGWDTMQEPGQKDLFGAKMKLSFAHMFRHSVSYSAKDRYTFGASVFYNYFKVGKHSDYYALSRDWSLRFFFAYRF